METYHYQPQGDSVSHEISAELRLDEESHLMFIVLSDGEEIGEVDVELLSNAEAFVSGVGPGEQINNGYLRPASFVIHSCLQDIYPDLILSDIDDQPISPSD